MTRPTQWFDDIKIGDTREFGDYEITAQAIIAFALEFDPQPFHIDPDAARHSIFGGLIASGWHTAAITMRLLADHTLSSESSMGSPGIDELRWLKPVRPGDRLRVRISVEETIPSRSKPDRGIVKSFTEVLNQNGETVMSMRGMTMLKRRPNVTSLSN